ncbi:MAG: hypothetical protein ACE5DQ_02125 [Candidatus Paceibacterota bacterium]
MFINTHERKECKLKPKKHKIWEVKERIFNENPSLVERVREAQKLVEQARKRLPESEVYGKKSKQNMRDLSWKI